MNKMKTALPYFAIIGLGIFFGFIISKFQTSSVPPFLEGNYAQYLAKAEAKVVMYGTQTCKFCTKTREYLSSKNIKFVDLDINASEEASGDFKALNGEEVPLVLIGNRQIRGFRPEQFDAALSLISPEIAER